MPVNLLDDPEMGTESKDYHWTLNFGPQHPATHTTLRLVLDLVGERIVKATPYIGYLHSGFEKLGEHLTFNQYVTIVDRKNYISPPMNEVAWHGAVEKLLDIVTVHLDRVPAEGRPPIGDRFRVVIELRRLTLAETIDVNDHAQIVEPMVQGGVGRLPHRAFRHFPVAKQHIRPVVGADPARVQCRPDRRADPLPQ